MTELDDVFERLKEVTTLKGRLELDDSDAYGGYRLVLVDKNGAHGRAYARSESSDRLDEKAMLVYLRTCYHFETQPFQDRTDSMKIRMTRLVKEGIERKGVESSVLVNRRVLDIRSTSEVYDELYIDEDGELVFVYDDGATWFADESSLLELITICSELE